MLFNVPALLAAIAQLSIHASATAIRRDGGPVVSLDYATFEGGSGGGTESFGTVSASSTVFGSPLSE